MEPRVPCGPGAPSSPSNPVSREDRGPPGRVRAFVAATHGAILRVMSLDPAETNTGETPTHAIFVELKDSTEPTAEGEVGPRL